MVSVPVYIWFSNSKGGKDVRLRGSLTYSNFEVEGAEAVRATSCTVEGSVMTGRLLPFLFLLRDGDKCFRGSASFCFREVDHGEDVEVGLSFLESTVDCGLGDKTALRRAVSLVSGTEFSVFVWGFSPSFILVFSRSSVSCASGERRCEDADGKERTRDGESDPCPCRLHLCRGAFQLRSLSWIMSSSCDSSPASWLADEDPAGEFARVRLENE